MHGKDLEDFKYYPKFLGICQSRLVELGSLTAAEFLEMHRKFKSLEVEQANQAPMKLKNIRLDLLKDDWTQLKAVEDPAVCVEGIFEFLKRLSDRK